MIHNILFLNFIIAALCLVCFIVDTQIKGSDRSVFPKWSQSIIGYSFLFSVCLIVTCSFLIVLGARW